MGIENKCAGIGRFPPGILEEIQKKLPPGFIIVPPAYEIPLEEIEKKRRIPTSDQPNDVWIPPPGKQPEQRTYFGNQLYS